MAVGTDPLLNLGEVFGLSGLRDMGITNLKDLMNLSRVKAYIADDTYAKLVGLPGSGKYSYSEDVIYGRLVESIGINRNNVFNNLMTLCGSGDTYVWRLMRVSSDRISEQDFNQLPSHLKNLFKIGENFRNLSTSWSRLSINMTNVNTNFSVMDSWMNEFTLNVDKIILSIRGADNSVNRCFAMQSSWNESVYSYLSGMHGRVFGTDGLVIKVKDAVEKLQSNYSYYKTKLDEVRSTATDKPMGAMIDAFRSVYQNLNPTYYDTRANFLRYRTLSTTRPVDLMFRRWLEFGDNIKGKFAEIRDKTVMDMGNIVTGINNYLFASPDGGFKYLMLSRPSLAVTKEGMFLTQFLNRFVDVNGWLEKLRSSSEFANVLYYAKSAAGNHLFTDVFFTEMTWGWREVVVTQNYYSVTGRGMLDTLVKYLDLCQDLYLDDQANVLQDIANFGVAMYTLLRSHLRPFLERLFGVVGQMALLVDYLRNGGRDYYIGNLSTYFNNMKSDLESIRDRMFTLMSDANRWIRITVGSNLSGVSDLDLFNLEESGFQMSKVLNLLSANMSNVASGLTTLSNNQLKDISDKFYMLQTDLGALKTAIEKLTYGFGLSTVPDIGSKMNAVLSSLNFSTSSAWATKRKELKTLSDIGLNLFYV